ncbi:putative hydrolase of the HAD superfamily [Cohaesibacter marisflavi]|uniref:Putative hydrolase of the HAD superfamily n=1 Tax=Cohaesibacter marisflavi TaxID=655353 RepID=A0A1I5GVA5_9HYPH|nr:pyrimidine 5'-nucleotidase [Cohaesibacter marisflavi]SFO39958.1 putative hydrolase of the HAD superfamily [Cohaesibacter marisflavi]
MQSDHGSGTNLLESFRDIDSWIFDLDNTLYPRHIDLFAQMEVKMNEFVSNLLGLTLDDASHLRHSYYKQYGTTLRGLMIEHDIAPDDFLEYVHDIDHSVVEPDPLLGQALCSLPGKRYIYTNGTKDHARKVSERLGITDYFDDVFDIVWAGLEPKPNRTPYERLLEQTGINPSRSAMFEDLARNLQVPDALGMTCVLIVPDQMRDVFHGRWEAESTQVPYVHHVTDNLGRFLSDVLEAIGRGAPNTPVRA